VPVVATLSLLPEKVLIACPLRSQSPAHIARSYHRVTGWLAVGLRDRYRRGRYTYPDLTICQESATGRSCLLRIGNIQRAIQRARLWSEYNPYSI
jgi:hypothetical protein